jgi:hypothetical protein
VQGVNAKQRRKAKRDGYIVDRVEREKDKQRRKEIVRKLLLSLYWDNPNKASRYITMREQLRAR